MNATIFPYFIVREGELILCVGCYRHCWMPTSLCGLCQLITLNCLSPTGSHNMELLHTRTLISTSHCNIHWLNLTYLPKWSSTETYITSEQFILLCLQPFITYLSCLPLTIHDYSSLCVNLRAPRSLVGDTERVFY